jgi:PAS domain S-box-containing protein
MITTEQSHNHGLWALAVFLIGLLVSGWLALNQADRNREHLDVAIDERSQRVVDDVAALMHDFSYGLRGARGVVITAGEQGIDRRRFAQYAGTRDIDQEFPGARGFGFIRRVAVADETTYLAHAASRGWPGLHIRQLAPHDGERMVIEQIEPLQRNAEAVGLDIASEGNRRAAALAAMRSGNATLTAPITLVQASGRSLRSFLLLLPVYRPGLPLDSAEQRERAAFGWSYAPLISDEILSRLDVGYGQVALTLHDVTDPAQAQMFFSSGAAPRAAVLSRSHIRLMYGRMWSFQIDAMPSFVASQRLTDPGTVFASGALLSFLLAGAVPLAARGALRRRQLASERAHMATIVRNSADAIVGQGLDGRVTLWNRAAERLFGHSEAQALGRPLAELLMPNGALLGERELIHRAASGATVAPFDTVCTHRDGRFLDVSITAAAIEAERGRSIGVALLMRDIGPRMAQERQLRAFNAQLETEVAARTRELDATRAEMQRALDAVPAMLGYYDRDRKLRYANRAYQAWLGGQIDELRGAAMHELIPPEAMARVAPHVDGALAGQAQSFARDLSHSDGSGWRHGQVHLLPDEQQGVVQGFHIFAHDVTELVDSRQLMAGALARNQALLGAITQHALYSETDRLGRIVAVNDHFCTISGYAREELLGQDHRLVNSGFHPSSFWVEMWRTVSVGRVWRGEVRNRAKDGSAYWVESVIAPLPGLDGKPAGYFSLRFDITGRKDAEAQLLGERLRLDNILRGTAAGTWDWHIDSGALTINPRWAQIIGQRVEDLTPVSIQTRIDCSHPDELASSREMLRRHFAGETEFYDFEGRVRHRDGHWVWVLDRGRVSERDDRGRAMRIQGTMIDISARKLAEESLARREHLMRLVIDHFPGVLAHWDTEMRCTLANRGYQEWTSRSPSEMVGLSQRELLGAEEFERDLPLLQAVLQGQPQRVERSRITTAGREVHYVLHYIPDTDGDRVNGFISATTDITELKQTQQALELRSAQAEQASVAKGEFLANMSHEIRTPLNAMLGVNHLLASTELDVDQRELLGKAEMAGRSLLGIVNDVLDLAKIEAGGLSLDEQDFSFDALLGEVQAVYGVQAKAKGLELRLDTDPRLPPQVHGDAMRLRQILTNLVSNALKFTASGQVRVLTEVLAADEHRLSLRLEVRDTGAGIEPEVLARLFQPFTQGDASTARQHGGTGLGLSIVRRLATLMGGEAGADSELGQGSRFWVRLPFQPVAGGADERSQLFELAVVDADADERMAVVALARQMGWRCCDLGSAAELLSLMADRRDRQRPLPDVIAIDTRLRAVAGASLADALAEAGAGQVPPLTVWLAPPGTRPSVVNAEDPPVLLKPLTGSTLFNAVNGHWQGHAEQAERVLQATRFDPQSCWLAGVRVLVVDDSEVNLDIARRLLEREGARVQTCLSGSEALLMVSVAPQDMDVVLMDIQMPGMDGLETTRRLRAMRPDLGVQDLPVLALTAGVLGEERRRAMAAGMDDFLGKPLDPGALVRMVRRHVERYRGVALAAERRDDVSIVQQTSWPAIDGIDAHDSAARLLGDASLLLQALRRLRQEFADLCDGDLALPTEGGERERLAARAHKLCGGAGQIGAQDVSRWAGQLELALRAAPGSAAAERADADFQQLVQALRMLFAAAAAHLGQAAAPPLPATAETGGVELQPALDAGQVRELLDRLTLQDLDAIERIESLAVPLARWLGPQGHARLQRAAQDLDFVTARELLEAMPELPA